MRRYPAKLGRAGKAGTNMRELSGGGETEKAGKHLSNYTWPLSQRKLKALRKNYLLLNIFLETMYVWRLVIAI